MKGHGFSIRNHVRNLSIITQQKKCTRFELSKFWESTRVCNVKLCSYNQGHVKGLSKQTRDFLPDKSDIQSKRNSEDARALTLQVRKADSLLELRSLLLRHAKILNFIHASTSLAQAVRLVSGRSITSSERICVKDIINVSASTIASDYAILRPQDISSAIYSLGRLNSPEVSIYGPLLQRSEKALSGFNPQELCNMLWGLSSLEISPGKAWLDGAAAASLSRLPDYNIHDLARTLWAFASLGYNPGSAWFKPFNDQSMQKMALANSQDLSNMIWAFATLNISPNKAWLTAITERARSQLSQFTPQGLSNMIWAMAKLNFFPTPTWLNFYCQAVNDTSAKGVFSPQNLSNILWGLAKLGVGHSSIVPLVDATWELLPKMSPQGLSNSVWAMAKVGTIISKPRQAQLLDILAASCKFHSSPALVALLWSLSRLGCTPTPSWLRSFLQPLIEDLSVLEAPALVSLAGSLRELEVRPDEDFSSRFLSALQAHLQILDRITLHRILNLVSSLRMRPSSEWMNIWSQSFAASSGSLSVADAQQVELICQDLMSRGSPNTAAGLEKDLLLPASANYNGSSRKSYLRPTDLSLDVAQEQAPSLEDIETESFKGPCLSRELGVTGQNSQLSTPFILLDSRVDAHQHAVEGNERSGGKAGVSNGSHSAGVNASTIDCAGINTDVLESSEKSGSSASLVKGGKKLVQSIRVQRRRRSAKGHKQATQRDSLSSQDDDESDKPSKRSSAPCHLFKNPPISKNFKGHKQKGKSDSVQRVPHFDSETERPFKSSNTADVLMKELPISTLDVHRVIGASELHNGRSTRRQTYDLCIGDLGPNPGEAHGMKYLIYA